MTPTRFGAPTHCHPGAFAATILSGIGAAVLQAF